MADTAALWFCFFLWGDGLGVVGLLWEAVRVVLLDAVQEGGLLLAVPGSPGALVSGVAVDDVEGALVVPLALEGAFLGVCGPDGIYGGEGVLVGGVEGAEEGGRGGVDGGVGGVAEDGVREVLCLEGMVGHGLLLNVASKGVLVAEAVAIGKGVLGALDGEEEVAVGDIYEYLEVGLGWVGMLEDMRRRIERLVGVEGHGRQCLIM